MVEQIASRVEILRTRIAAAAQRAGRQEGEITLVAVSKTHPPAAVLAALAAGISDFGENRIQEALPKMAQLAAQRAQIRWHLIGHLQRNKARDAVTAFDLIHSLDSLRLAEALEAALTRQHPAPATRLPVLLQVNVSGEQSKSGFLLPGGPEHPALPQLLSEIEQIAALPQLQIRGLMTIGPLSADPEAARRAFRNLRRLQEVLAQRLPGNDWSQLSMGMSGDYEAAIEEGSTLIRIGSAIFGPRETSM